MAERPHKRTSLGIKRSHVKAQSALSSHAKHDVTREDLTDMFMPLYSYSWKGYGHNNVVWHTMKNFTGMSNSVNGLDPRGGDCVALSCLPGRQVYAEFNALPLSNLFMLGGQHASTATFRAGYNMYCRSLSELAERCMMHNNFFPRNQNVADDWGMIDVTDVATGLIKSLFTSNSFDMFLNTNAGYFATTKLQDIEFYYEGGMQSHKFTNTTSLPVYIEFREFMPKTVLANTYVYGNFDTNPSVDGAAYKTPGLYETIFADLIRQKQRQNTLDAPLFPDQTGLFDDMDDKAFKYNKYMKITNQRFVVGEVCRVRVDPGNTFNYVMNLPAFKLSFHELWEYNQFYNFVSTANGHPAGYQGPVVIGTSGGAMNYYPKFSKFLQVRAYGSVAFTQGAPGSSVPVINQKDGMSDPIVTGVDYTLASDDNQDMNPHAIGAVRTASHAVQLLHSVTETHNCRIKPVCGKYHKETFNYLPNARDKASITVADDMGFLDPTSLAQEGADGDMIE